MNDKHEIVWTRNQDDPDYWTGTVAGGMRLTVETGAGNAYCLRWVDPGRPAWPIYLQGYTRPTSAKRGAERWLRRMRRLCAPAAPAGPLPPCPVCGCHAVSRCVPNERDTARCGCPISDYGHGAVYAPTREAAEAGWRALCAATKGGAE